jgi:hypothetical protein
VVDDDGRAEPVQELMVLRAGRSHHGGPEDACDLHREMTEPARPGRDQNAVPGADFQHIGQALLRGQRVDRCRRRIGGGQPGRDQG